MKLVEKNFFNLVCLTARMGRISFPKGFPASGTFRVLGRTLWASVLLIYSILTSFNYCVSISIRMSIGAQLQPSDFRFRVSR